MIFNFNNHKRYLMSENQGNKLEIPGKDTFLFDFKFNLEAPCLPIPQMKTLSYP